MGAVLAGGRASRFGSDKALALLEGRPLIAWVSDSLAAMCSAVVVCGREMAGYTGLRDRPGPGLGPLGGLTAALFHARDHGFDQVLCAPCDTPRLPADLLTCLGEAPAFVAATPVIGVWPAALADKLESFMQNDPRRSMRGWAAMAEARAVNLPPIANVNAPDDLAQL